MTPWEAYTAGKAAGCESYLRDHFNSTVMMHLSRSSWILRAKGWPVDPRAEEALKRAFRTGWDVGTGGEVVEA